jgi:hypothetical protein
MELSTTSRLATLLVCTCALGCAAEPASNGTDNGGAPASAGTSSVSGGTNAASGGSPTAPGGTTSGGSGTSAGAAGSSAGGSPAGGSGSGCAAIDPMNLISDFETGKADVNAAAGRDGSWFLYSDGTGMQTPVKVLNTPLPAEAGGACGSAYAFHTTGTGFTVWGAGIGTDLAPKVGMARGSYDLSAYSGVALQAKAAATTPLRISISDANTAPEGMVCKDTTDAADHTRCGDYFGTEVTLTTEFQDFTIKFSDLKQRGYGLPIMTGFDKTRAYTLRMQVKGSAQAPATFDLWIDNVRLVP